MKIADFLWPPSREPVLRTPGRVSGGLPERSGNGRAARKLSFRVIEGGDDAHSDLRGSPRRSSGSRLALIWLAALLAMFPAVANADEIAARMALCSAGMVPNELLLKHNHDR
jgi:hypothetical protein